MKNTLFHSKSRLQYLLSARHRRGHRVHSPYVFHFLNHVLFEKRNYYCYTALSDIRLRMLRDKRVIELPAIGTAMQSRESRVCDVARGSVKSEKYACLLFRLALFSEARTIIELGTSLGLSTLYLSSASVKSKVYSFEGVPVLCEYARQLFKRYTKRGEIELVEGLIDETLSGVVSKLDKIDLAFLDANHTLDATLRYFDVMQSKFHSGSIVVVDDIYWSEDMHRAWDILRERSEVHVDINIFGMGILIFNSELPKQSYKVAF